mgnify:CR=1 FL=1
MISFPYQVGPWDTTFTFESPEEFARWILIIHTIKQGIISIDSDDANPDYPPQIPRYRECLGLVRGLLPAIGGEAMLPPDIKHAVHRAEGIVGDPLTVWQDPPDNYLRAANLPANPSASSANAPANPSANPSANPPTSPSASPSAQK